MTFEIVRYSTYVTMFLIALHALGRLNANLEHLEGIDFSLASIRLNGEMCTNPKFCEHQERKQIWPPDASKN